MSELNKGLRQFFVFGLDGFEQGQHFRKWPPHITLVTWFRNADQILLDRQLETLRQSSEPIVARLGRRATFKGDVHVTLVDDDHVGSLQKFHEQLLGIVASSGGVIEKDEFLGADYNPHVTDQNGVAIDGILPVIDHVAVVRADNALGRVVDAVYWLRGNETAA